MSKRENEATVTAAGESSSAHREDAQTRLQQLRVMRAEIPRFVIPTSPKDAIRLNSAASVPPEFVELTAVAVANHNALVRGDGATPAEVRDLMSYAEAYLPMADELEAFAYFIRFSVAAARHKAGTEALTTYALAKRLAKSPETASLAPHVADMRRALGRGRRPSAETSAKKKAENEAGTSTTPPDSPKSE